MYNPSGQVPKHLSLIKQAVPIVVEAKRAQERLALALAQKNARHRHDAETEQARVAAEAARQTLQQQIDAEREQERVAAEMARQQAEARRAAEAEQARVAAEMARQRVEAQIALERSLIANAQANRFPILAWPTGAYVRPGGDAAFDQETELLVRANRNTNFFMFTTIAAVVIGVVAFTMKPSRRR